MRKIKGMAGYQAKFQSLPSGVPDLLSKMLSTIPLKYMDLTLVSFFCGLSVRCGGTVPST